MLLTNESLEADVRMGIERIVEVKCVDLGQSDETIQQQKRLKLNEDPDGLFVLLY